MEPAQEITLSTNDPLTVAAAVESALSFLSDPSEWGFASAGPGGIEDSFVINALPRGETTVLEISNTAPHFAFLLEGTGRYGRGVEIRPRRQKVLAFKAGGRQVFSSRSRGVNPHAAGRNRVDVPGTYEHLLREAIPELIRS